MIPTSEMASKLPSDLVQGDSSSGVINSASAKKRRERKANIGRHEKKGQTKKACTSSSDRDPKRCKLELTKKDEEI